MCKKLILLISIVLVLSLGNVANADLSKGLVVRLDFGTDCSDSSDNGHHGTKGSGVQVNGGIATFDGTANAYVDIELGTDNPCNGTSDYTVAVAYACTNTGQGELESTYLMTMAAPGGFDEAENAFGFVTYGDLGAMIDIWGINACHSADHSFTYADGSLHIIVVTYDADGGDNAFSWYHVAYDGTVTALGIGTPWAPDPPMGQYEAVSYDTYTTRLGGIVNEAYVGDMGFDFLDDEMDFVAIWNRIVLEDEMPDMAEGGGDPNLATNPRPGKNEEFVDPAVVLIWDDPNEQLHPDPNFDVFLGVHSDTNDDPNVVRDVNTLDPTPDMNWGTQYFWRVDTIGADDTVYKNVDWNFTTGGKTWDPDPDHNDWWVPLDVNLYWQGDKYVQTYNLDFNSTSPPDPCQTGLTEPNFLTLTTLKPFTTYYWQVAEVNATRGGVLHAGDIWKFTTEDPCGVPYDDYLGAGHDIRIETWDSNSEQGDAENLVNGSGIDTETMLDDVGTGDTEWNGYVAVPTPEVPGAAPNPYPLDGLPNALPWVMFDLGYEYELWLTWIWNCNAFPLDGMRYYTVHYSVGGAGAPETWSWSQLGDVYELPRAPDVDGEGQPGYAGSAGPAFQGTNARYILFTSLQNWGGTTVEVALSEVKFELFPRYEAVGPVPSDGAIDVPIDVNLAWTPGASVQQAGAHEIFFGETWDVVNDACNPTWTKALGSELVELPDGLWSLEVGTEYFWRVDEVNDACAGNGSPWRGDIWSFTTEPFVRLDDFEAYRSLSCLGSPRHLRCIWEDYYWGVPRLGSFDYISSATADVCPGGPHGGAQSMRVKYMTDFAQNDDPDRVFTRRTYSSVQNWSEPLAALSIWFFGDLNDVAVAGGSERITAEDMYVTLEDEQGDKAKIYYVADGGDDVDDLIAKEWIEWHIALRDFNEVNDINLDKIDSISIGVKFNGALPLSKQKGQVWLDDIRVYAQRCVPKYAVDFNSAPYSQYLGGPDCYVDEWDVAAMFSDWLVGDANYFSVAPGDANLLVEYLFDACDLPGTENDDLYDSSGNERHGIAINDVNVHAGMLTLVNTAEVNDFNTVRIPLDANTFNGPRPFTIVMDVNIEPGSVLFGVSPPSPNDPCDESTSYQSYDQAMTLFHTPSGEFGTDAVVRDNSFQANAGVIDNSGVAHGQWYTVATTSDGNGGQAMYLIKGRQMWVAENADFPEDGPQMLLPERHKVMIGYSYHLAFNDPEFGDFMGAEAMTGDADNVRVYNRVLSIGEIVYLSGVPAGESIYMPVDSMADLYEDEPAATGLESTRWVNFKDYVLLVEHWLEYQPFPPDEE